MATFNNFRLYGSDSENFLLGQVLRSLPAGKVTQDIAIYTTTPRFGIYINPVVQDTCKIIFLSDKLFNTKHDPSDEVYRFLTFTVFHELAHVVGIADEDEADRQAITWYDEHIDNDLPGTSKFTLEEKKATQEKFEARDWIYVSRKEDNNGNLAVYLGTKLVNAFIDTCEKEKKGVSTVFKQLVEDYISNN